MFVDLNVHSMGMLKITSSNSEPLLDAYWVIPDLIPDTISQSAPTTISYLKKKVVQNKK